MLSGLPALDMKLAESRTLDVSHRLDQLSPCLLVKIPEPLAQPSRCGLQIQPALRHVEICAHCGSVMLRLFTGIVVSRLSLFVELGTRRWTAIFSPASSSHMPSSSITLRAPTCSNVLANDDPGVVARFFFFFQEVARGGFSMARSGSRWLFVT